MKNSTEIELKLFECLPIRLQQRLKELNLTQKELSSRSGVSEQTLSAWMKQTKSPSFAALVAVCEVLDCSIDYLTGHDSCSTHDLQGVVSYTGLSEQAAAKLHKSAPDLKRILSKIICSPDVLPLIYDFLNPDVLIFERGFIKQTSFEHFEPDYELFPVDSENLSINGIPINKEIFRQSIMNLLRDALINLSKDENTHQQLPIDSEIQDDSGALPFL